MARRSLKLEILVWGFLGAVIISIVAAFLVERFGGKRMEKLRELPNFSLTNQLNQTITLNDLKGQVWLANIIFTRCPGPCVRMTKHFAELQAALPKDQSVKLVSLTADPAFDNPDVLKTYAERFEADPSRWHFLTGPKKDVYQLALEGLLLAVQEKPLDQQESIDDLFIHSTMIVLVDKQGVLRRFYESTDPGVDERILSDVKALLRQ